MIGSLKQSVYFVEFEINSGDDSDHDDESDDDSLMDEDDNDDLDLKAFKSKLKGKNETE